MRRLPDSAYSLLTPGFAYSGYQMLIGAGSFRRKFLNRPDVFTPGSLVLDIGCGPGEAAKQIQPADYVGYEPNSKYVERARREYGAWGEFHCGDALDVPADFHCDVVLLMAMLSCVPGNVLTYTLQTARRVLRPGGCSLRTMVSTPTANLEEASSCLTSNAMPTSGTWMSTGLPLLSSSPKPRSPSRPTHTGFLTPWCSLSHVADLEHRPTSDRMLFPFR